MFKLLLTDHYYSHQIIYIMRLLKPLNRAMDDGGGLPEGCAANGAFVRDKNGATWYGCSTDDGTFCMTPNGNPNLAKCYSPQ